MQNPINSYGAAFVEGIPEVERRRLGLQAEVFRRSTEWTMDALNLGPGSCVADLGCGNGAILTAIAERVGPTGRVVGVERDPQLVAAASRHLASYPWVELVEADALNYKGGNAAFDAVHCRLVLMHQADPEAFLAQMVALTRPAGRVAAQEFDCDGPTGEPAVICFPTFAALERLGWAYLTTSLRRGTDVNAGRKLLDRFQRLGLSDLAVDVQALAVPLTDSRAEIVLDLFGRSGAGAQAEAAGVCPAVEYEVLLEQVRRAHQDSTFSAHLYRLWTSVAVVGTKTPVNG